VAKKVKAIITLQIEAGKANPAPPIGPALAQHGVNIMAFCKDYNGRTVQQPFCFARQPALKKVLVCPTGKRLAQ